MVGVTTCACVLRSMLGSCLAWFWQAPCTLPQSLWVPVCTSPVVSGKPCFLGVNQGLEPPLPLRVFPHTSTNSSLCPDPEGRDLMQTSHLGPSAPKSPTLCTLSSYGSPFNSAILSSREGHRNIQRLLYLTTISFPSPFRTMFKTNQSSRRWCNTNY